MFELEKYAKQWVNQTEEPPCRLDDDPKRYREWSDEMTKKWQAFLVQLPSPYRKKFISNVLGVKTSFWIAIPTLKKQIEIEYKIKDIEKEGYIITKKEK